MRLTKGESEILLHRLEATDAIAECLCEDDGTLDYNDVFACAESLLVTVRDTSRVRDDLSEMEKMVLENCLSASVFATLEEPGSKSHRSAVRRGQGLCRKMAPLLGRLVTFPVE